MSVPNLACYLDLANHKPETGPQEIKILCDKVKQYGFHTAFVNSYWVSLAKKILGETGKVGTVVSFPLGQDTTQAKIAASLDAVKNGADELDISANVGLLKSKNLSAYQEELSQIVTAVKKVKPTTIVKFIIETGLLTGEEIKKACQLVLNSRADFVKTCSGFGPRGARLEDVKLIKEAVGDKIKIKVAGGIKTYDQAVAFISAGVNRIGTSKAVEIVTQQ